MCVYVYTEISLYIYIYLYISIYIYDNTVSNIIQITTHVPTYMQMFVCEQEVAVSLSKWLEEAHATLTMPRLCSACKNRMLCHTYLLTMPGWGRPVPHPLCPKNKLWLEGAHATPTATHSVQADPVLIHPMPTSACCSRFDIPCSHACQGEARRG